MKRRIIRASAQNVKAATQEAKEQVFKEKLDKIEDDFSFAMAGLEKLFRGDGAQGDAANTLATKLSDALQGCISEMAEQL